MAGGCVAVLVGGFGVVVVVAAVVAVVEVVVVVGVVGGGPVSKHGAKSKRSWRVYLHRYVIAEVGYHTLVSVKE